MLKSKTSAGHTCPEAFQMALDALDVIGTWEWDAATDRTQTDAFVALLFNLDPEEAEVGAPLSSFINGIHPEDRQRVTALIQQNAQAGSSFIAEYRVCSADGVIRWVLARGRFSCDHRGQPVGGRGIIVDITRVRMDEEAPVAADLQVAEPPLERAAGHAISAQRAIVELQDPALKMRADALLLDLGRKLAQQEVQDRRRRMN